MCTGHLLTVLSRHYQQIKCIKCTDDGTCFVTAGDDNLVIAWNLAKYEYKKGILNLYTKVLVLTI